MTTDAIIALIDARLSKAHLDGKGEAALSLNELRERIVAGPESRCRFSPARKGLTGGSQSRMGL